MMYLKKIKKRSKDIVLSFFLLLLSLFAINNIYTQELAIRFEVISDENDQISKSSVYAITQDNVGFIWFATQNGLYKYDGYKFSLYQNKKDDQNSLSSNYITSIFSDSSDILWIGTLENGLNKG